eukprot:3022581-Pyramimonas_sp.AAC.1
MQSPLCNHSRYFRGGPFNKGCGIRGVGSRIGRATLPPGAFRCFPLSPVASRSLSLSPSRSPPIYLYP